MPYSVAGGFSGCCTEIYSLLLWNLASEKGPLACTFAALILSDEKAPINSDNITKLLKAANVECEAYWPALIGIMCSDVLTSSIFVILLLAMIS